MRRAHLFFLVGTLLLLQIFSTEGRGSSGGSRSGSSSSSSLGSSSSSGSGSNSRPSSNSSSKLGSSSSSGSQSGLGPKRGSGSGSSGPKVGSGQTLMPGLSTNLNPSSMVGARTTTRPHRCEDIGGKCVPSRTQCDRGSSQDSCTTPGHQCCRP